MPQMAQELRGSVRVAAMAAASDRSYPCLLLS
jgi:hypothetical protein